MNEAAAVERRLLAAWLALVLALVYLEGTSKTASIFRSQRPWEAWLYLEPAATPATPENLFLLSYSWGRRTLHLMSIPETPASRKAYRNGSEAALAQYFDGELPGQVQATSEGGSPPLGNPSNAGGTHRLLLRWPKGPEAASSDVLKAWIASRPKSLRFWLYLPHVFRSLRRANPGIGAYDASIIARELYRLESFRIRPETLPPAAELPAFFTRLASAASSAPGGPIPVSVLNASGEAGVALQATKVLRWRGLDVVDFGNATAVSPETRLIDHSAFEGEADAVVRLLGCGELDIADEIDTARRERLTIVLGRDFRRCALLNRSLGKP